MLQVPFTGHFSVRFDLEIQAAIEPTVIDFGRAVFFYTLGNAATDHDTLTEEDLFLRDFTTTAHHSAADHATMASSVRLRFDAFHKRITVTNPAIEKRPFFIRILRTDGQTVAHLRSTGNSVSLSTSALSSGVYLAVVTTAETCNHTRFIITR